MKPRYSELLLGILSTTIDRGRICRSRKTRRSRSRFSVQTPVQWCPCAVDCTTDTNDAPPETTKRFSSYPEMQNILAAQLARPPTVARRITFTNSNRSHQPCSVT
jgi:hypothetical protein